MPSWLIVFLTIVTTLAVVFVFSEWIVRRSRTTITPVLFDEEDLLEP